MELPEYIDPELWADFEQHRIEIKHKLTKTATRYLLIKLKRFNKSGIDVNACLIAAIENSWRGVFEVQAKKEKLPKDNDLLAAWGMARGYEAKVGEGMWAYRDRLQDTLQ